MSCVWHLVLPRRSPWHLRIASRLFVVIDLVVCWTVGFGLFGFRFPNFSAEMCAGSLASGCKFSLRFLYPKETIVVIFDAQNCDLGGLVPAYGSLGAPWEIVRAARNMWGLESNFVDLGII